VVATPVDPGRGGTCVDLGREHPTGHRREPILVRLGDRCLEQVRGAGDRRVLQRDGVDGARVHRHRRTAHDAPHRTERLVHHRPATSAANARAATGSFLITVRGTTRPHSAATRSCNGLCSASAARPGGGNHRNGAEEQLVQLRGAQTGSTTDAPRHLLGEPFPGCRVPRFRGRQRRRGQRVADPTGRRRRVLGTTGRGRHAWDREAASGCQRTAPGHSRLFVALRRAALS
jgi:hypothetical protein